jgi:multidrug resistance efflux pump
MDTPLPPSSSPHPSPAHEPVAHATPKSSKRKKAIVIMVILFMLGVAAGIAYWIDQQKYVYTDKSAISADVISLTPHTPGALKRVMVHDGDVVSAHQDVARVGDEMIMTEIGGVVLEAKRDIGGLYAAGQPVVTMIDPAELRVTARVEEDKGLKDVRVGQKALFTVDAYGSEEFEGTVESVSRTSREGDVVFNISDKREEKEFEVKIQYDHDRYPFFQNGMSAKVWIVK